MQPGEKMLRLLGPFDVAFTALVFGIQAGTVRLRKRCRTNGRKGFGTLEIVIIIAVLLAIALIFRKTLLQYANSLISAVFDQSIIDDMGNYTLQ